MAFRSRIWGLGKLVVLAGALLATFFLSFAVAMRLAVRSREVTVPDLVGQSINDASARLAELGLTLAEEEGRRRDPVVPEGLVAAQDPPPGASARRPRSIRVWVSGGNRAAVVPSVVGDNERTAQLRIEMDALTVAAIAEVRSGSYPAGVVVAQNPPPNATGTDVGLLVNRGERASTYVMPDLIGVDGARAAEVLRAEGFRVAVVGDHPYPGVPPGIVLRQFPRAGFQIAPGEPISLEVSQ